MLFSLKCLLYVRYFLNTTMSKFSSNSNKCIPKIYMIIKMTDFDVKPENILMGFISIHEKIYVS